MEPIKCRELLGRLLADETRLLATLEQQLGREHELLKSNDVDGLDLAARERQTCVAGLMRIDDERRNLCRLLGRSPDQAGLAALLEWCDPQGSLAAAHAECALHAQRCREQNDRNGALVAARLSRVSGMLNMLAANGSGSTYEPRTPARTGAPPSAGRMVSISA